MSLVASVSELDVLNGLDVQPPWMHQVNQPVTYPRMFVEVAQDYGVSREQVLRYAGLPANILDDPAGRLSLLETWKVLLASLCLTGDPTLGFQNGLRLPLTAHGSLGYALMCASTAREALTILERFWHVRGRGVLLMVSETNDAPFFELVPELPMPSALRDLAFSSMLTSMYRGMQFVLPMLPASSEIWLQGAEPAGFQRWQPQLPAVHFDMPRAGIVLQGDRSWLDQPLPTANPEALAQAIAQCERENALLDAVDDVVRQTRAALSLEGGGYPTPEQLADKLHLTPRTLRRRLQDQGQSYRDMLEEARCRDGCQLLANPDLEIQRISELLGYNDPANFTRAFKSWMGVTPSEWRAQRL
ncbi:AraC-type DNA-binding protein [Marinobacter zhejiangensis]|uniref:AraC-type DNA-binding protein n=1 Tax=Marinobacter zhejiangensis TaxID=488535 RepID=A0A1I4LW72_9GAMM|nr:AraC-type DNA-binding protein [Marinobacter zhejiangensis]